MQERKKLLTFVIVGGGPTGVEVAAELHESAFERWQTAGWDGALGWHERPRSWEALLEQLKFEVVPTDRGVPSMRRRAGATIVGSGGSVECALRPGALTAPLPSPTAQSGIHNPFSLRAATPPHHTHACTWAHIPQ